LRLGIQEPVKLCMDVQDGILIVMGSAKRIHAR
jgi:hypothetical protein